MAKKKGKKSNNTALFVIIAIIAILVIVAIIVIFVVNPGGIKDKIMNAINGQQSNSNSNSGGGSQNQSNLAHGEGELQFHMLDTQQGDWLLLLLPDGKEMLIDAGSKPDPASTYTTNKAYMDQYVTDGQLDYVVLTHSDQDHVAYMDKIFTDYQSCRKTWILGSSI